MNASDGHIEKLMQQALAGDKRAYNEALKDTVRLLRPYISKRLNNKSDVEEVLQEILVSIHRALHTYDGNRPYAPWAYAIAKFRLQDHLRTVYSDNLRFAAELTEAENISASDVTESSLSYESIKEELRLLPEKQAQILHLMHSEGYTAREVGEKIGMNTSAVKVAAHRAYKVLKKRLGES